MTERERLIELISNSNALQCCGCHYNSIEFYCNKIADYLLANGVVALPCKVGTHLYRVTHPYKKAPKVTEYVVKNFRTFGKKHNLQIEVQALNVPITNWMNYTDFHKTKEEAVQALKESEKND